MKNYNVTLKGNKYYQALRQQRKDLRSTIVKDLLLNCEQALDKALDSGNDEKVMEYVYEGRAALYSLDLDYDNLDDNKLVATHELFYSRIYDHLQKLNYNKYPDYKLNKQLASSDMLFEISCRLKKLEALTKFVETVSKKMDSQSQISLMSVNQKDEYTFDITFDSSDSHYLMPTIGQLVAYLGTCSKSAIKTNSSIRMLRISTRSFTNGNNLADDLYSIVGLDPTNISNATGEEIVKYPF